MKLPKVSRGATGASGLTTATGPPAGGGDAEVERRVRRGSPLTAPLTVPRGEDESDISTRRVVIEAKSTHEMIKHRAIEIL